MQVNQLYKIIGSPALTEQLVKKAMVTNFFNLVI